jgi:hypothetical protein
MTNLITILQEQHQSQNKKQCFIEKRFKIQSDKIPIFNLKNITGGNKFYTPDHGNTRNKSSNHIIYNDVQEIILNSCSNYVTQI